MADFRGCRMRQADDAGKVRYPGKNIGCTVDEVAGGLVLAEDLRNRLLRGFGQVVDFEQAVDEKPVAGYRGNPPGRGMRRIDETHVFQPGHDIADRRRADIEARHLRQALGADRLRVARIRIDQLPQ